MDVSTVTHDMVDLSKGIISRKRAKTGKRKKVPKVTYKMWPLTLELMKKYKSNHPKWFLTTETGKAWVRRFIKEDGNMSRSDMIVSNFRHVKKRLKITQRGKSLMIFRKTSGNLLEQHERFAPVSTLFLGHAPTSVKGKHYVNPKQELLDAAIDWLATQYGF